MKCPSCGSNAVERQQLFEDGQATDEWFECDDCHETGDKFDFADEPKAE